MATFREVAGGHAAARGSALLGAADGYPVRADGVPARPRLGGARPTTTHHLIRRAPPDHRAAAGRSVTARLNRDFGWVTTWRGLVQADPRGAGRRWPPTSLSEERWATHAWCADRSVHQASAHVLATTTMTRAAHRRFAAGSTYDSGAVKAGWDRSRVRLTGGPASSA